jgi:hypothetical protein
LQDVRSGKVLVQLETTTNLATAVLDY